jgi:hypothetical protein
MKRSLLNTSLTFAVVLAFGTFILAQRGAAGGGMGRPTGAGPGNTGSAGMGSPNAGHPADAGSNSNSMGHAGGSGVDSHSPTTTLSNNGKLDTSLSNALAKSGVAVPGGNLQSACSGFKNLGQCVAALHVAKNLDIPGGFAALKDKMTGTNSVSLGKAIQQLDPKANAKAEKKKANKQADEDIRASAAES